MNKHQQKTLVGIVKVAKLHVSTFSVPWRDVYFDFHIAIFGYIQSNLPKRAPLHGKSLSIKASLIFPNNQSVYNLNRYIKGQLHTKGTFQVPLKVLYIQF